MTIYALIVMSVMLPICTITAFVIGYNITAEKKIFPRKKKKSKPTENDKLLEKIDNATVY